MCPCNLKWRERTKTYDVSGSGHKAADAPKGIADEGVVPSAETCREAGAALVCQDKETGAGSNPVRGSK